MIKSAPPRLPFIMGEADNTGNLKTEKIDASPQLYHGL
jgi:hypothetical protein